MNVRLCPSCRAPSKHSASSDCWNCRASLEPPRIAHSELWRLMLGVPLLVVGIVLMTLSIDLAVLFLPGAIYAAAGGAVLLVRRGRRDG